MYKNAAIWQEVKQFQYELLFAGLLAKSWWLRILLILNKILSEYAWMQFYYVMISSLLCDWDPVGGKFIHQS